MRYGKGNGNTDFKFSFYLQHMMAIYLLLSRTKNVYKELYMAPVVINSLLIYHKRFE